MGLPRYLRSFAMTFMVYLKKRLVDMGVFDGIVGELGVVFHFHFFENVGPVGADGFFA